MWSFSGVAIPVCRCVLPDGQSSQSRNRRHTKSFPTTCQSESMRSCPEFIKESFGSGELCICVCFDMDSSTDDPVHVESCGVTSHSADPRLFGLEFSPPRTWIAPLHQKVKIAKQPLPLFCSALSRVVAMDTAVIHSRGVQYHWTSWIGAAQPR